MKKVLIFITQTPSLRAKIEGCKIEDPMALIRARAQIRYNLNNTSISSNEIDINDVEPSSKEDCYPTGLHCLADGWNLLGPPQPYNERVRLNEEVKFWEWWMFK